MTTNVTGMYALGHDQLISAIIAIGSKRTILVQGHMGIGKSSLLYALENKLPTHTGIYFDATTKDLGDISLPAMMKTTDGESFVRSVPHEELGLHLRDTPLIINIDELAKPGGGRSVQNGLLRLIFEHKMGSYELHPDSIIFATSNLGSEGVGDTLQAHMRNRMVVVEARKPDAMEWIEWGINNGVEPIVLGWVRENPHCMQDFREVKDPEENPYIFHPRAVGRDSFVTPRSLHTASDILKTRDKMDSATLTALLIGAIGTRAALDMAAFITLADKLPTLKSIKETPETASVPTSAAAVCMVVYRALGSVDRSWLDAWMTYMNRLPAEAQGLFANGVRAPSYAKAGLVMTHRGFSDWARKNNYLFGADQ